MIVLHFVPDELSDEAAAHLLDYLYGLAGAFENQYFAGTDLPLLRRTARERTRGP